MRDRRLHGEEHSREIGLDHILKGFERCPADRRIASNASVSKHDVELAELLHGLCDGTFKLRDIGRVCLDAKSIRPEFGHSRIQSGLIPSRDRHPRTFSYKQLCSGETDAAVATGDECRFAFKPHGSLLLVTAMVS